MKLYTRFTKLESPKIKISKVTAIFSTITFVFLSRLLFFENQIVLSFFLTLVVTLIMAVTIFNIPKRSYFAWEKHQFRNSVMSSNFIDEEHYNHHLAKNKLLLGVLTDRDKERIKRMYEADRVR